MFRFLCFQFGIHSCGMGWVMVLWVGLRSGYDLAGWVGFGL